MKLTDAERRMLDGDDGIAKQRAMRGLVQLGDAFGAEDMAYMRLAVIDSGKPGNAVDARLIYMRILLADRVPARAEDPAPLPASRAPQPVSTANRPCATHLSSVLLSAPCFLPPSPRNPFPARAQILWWVASQPTEYSFGSLFGISGWTSPVSGNLSAA